MTTSNETYTASQGLIDRAKALSARTNQGSLDWRFEVTASLLLDDLADAKPLVAPAPDSALRDAAYEVLLGDQNCTTDEFAELLGDLQAALDTAPESEPIRDDERLQRAHKQHEINMAVSQKVNDDLKKQLAEAITRAEKAEAADGNAGLRKLRDLYAREVHGNGDYYAGCRAQRESFVGDIDRILKAAPQPERDDGPLIAFSVDDCGHRYDDALADAVSELCRREIARGQR